MKKWLFLACIVILAVCQMTFLDAFRFFGVKPDLLLIFCIISGLIFNFDLKWLLAGAALSGIFKDVFNVYAPGLNSVLFILIALLTAHISKKITLDSIPIQAGFTFCVCLLYNAVLRGIMAYMGNFISVGMFLRITILGSLYTALFFPVLFNLVQALEIEKADYES